MARIPLAAIVVAAIAMLAYRQIAPCSTPHAASFHGRSVVLTGASSGIGIELALQLGKAGARIVIAARRKAELEQTAAAALAAGAQDVLAVPTDTTVPAACSALIRAAAERFGGSIDVLLLNHALSEEYLVQEYGNSSDVEKSVGRTIMANLMGSVHLAHEALPYLERGRGAGKDGAGTISVVSSASAKVPAPFHAGYVASKRGLHGFFDTLRHELHLVRSRVTVGILVLGLIATPGITQDEGLGRVAMSVESCASAMLCDIAARYEETYIPRWMGLVSPLMMIHSGLTEMITNREYVGQVDRYAARIEAGVKQVEGWRNGTSA